VREGQGGKGGEGGKGYVNWDHGNQMDAGMHNNKGDVAMLRCCDVAMLRCCGWNVSNVMSCIA